MLLLLTTQAQNGLRVGVLCLALFPASIGDRPRCSFSCACRSMSAGPLQPRSSVSFVRCCGHMPGPPHQHRRCKLWRPRSKLRFHPSILRMVSILSSAPSPLLPTLHPHLCPSIRPSLLRTFVHPQSSHTCISCSSVDRRSSSRHVVVAAVVACPPLQSRAPPTRPIVSFLPPSCAACLLGTLRSLSCCLCLDVTVGYAKRNAAQGW